MVLRCATAGLLIAGVVSCGGASSSEKVESTSSNGDRNCADLRIVAQAAIAATTVDPAVEKDLCSDDGRHAVYEAFVKTRGQAGKAAHFKFTFNGLDARTGLSQICQDARTGDWECGP